MIDASRLDTTYIHNGLPDARVNVAIAHHYFTGQPVEAWLRDDPSFDRIADAAGRIGCVTRYYPEAGPHLDELYQALLDLDALLVVGYGQRRYTVMFMTPGGLRCRDVANPSQPIVPLTDLAALGDLGDALLCTAAGG